MCLGIWVQQLEWNQGSWAPECLWLEELERPKHVCTVCRCIRQCDITGCIKLHQPASRKSSLVDNYWSAHRSGLYLKETWGSESWMLQGLGSPCQVLERPWSLGVGYWRGPRSEPATDGTHGCMCVCVCAWGSWETRGAGPATERTECVTRVSGGIRMYRGMYIGIYFSLTGFHPEQSDWIIVVWLAMRMCIYISCVCACWEE